MADTQSATYDFGPADVEDSSFAPYRDLRFEALLNQFRLTPVAVNADYDIEYVHPREDQDDGHSTAQIRLIDKFDPEHVTALAEAMEAGDILPAGFANLRNPNDPHVDLGGGNHRLAALKKLKRPTMALYLLDVPNDVMQKLAEEEQSIAALPLTTNDKSRLIAVHVAEGLSNAEIARRLRMPRSKVNVIVSRMSFEDRVGGLGIDVDDPSMKRMIKSAAKAGPLSTLHDNEVFAQAVKIAATTAMSAEDIDTHAKALNALHDVEKEKEYLADLEVKRKAEKAREGAGIKPPAARQIRKHVTGILTFTAAQLVVGLSADDIVQLHEDMTALQALSTDVLARLDQTVAKRAQRTAPSSRARATESTKRSSRKAAATAASA